MAQRRFIRRGVSKFLFSAAVNDINAVTRAELDAAEDLTEYIAEVSGWQLENNSVATPDMGSTFESSIPGTDSASDSSFTFYEDLDEEIIETLLPKGTEGVVHILRKGDKPGSNSLDNFPVRSSTKGNEFSAGNDPARFSVRFNITSEPALDTLVPGAEGAAPIITNIAPANVAAAGSDQAVLTGVGFTGATSVTVDAVAVPATDFIVISDTKIALVTPAHAAGAVPVRVITPSGTSAPENITYV